MLNTLLDVFYTWLILGLLFYWSLLCSFKGFLSLTKFNIGIFLSKFILLPFVCSGKYEIKFFLEPIIMFYQLTISKKAGIAWPGLLHSPPIFTKSRFAQKTLNISDEHLRVFIYLECCTLKFLSFWITWCCGFSSKFIYSIAFIHDKHPNKLMYFILFLN